MSRDINSVSDLIHYVNDYVARTGMACGTVLLPIPTFLKVVTEIFEAHSYGSDGIIAPDPADIRFQMNTGTVHLVPYVGKYGPPLTTQKAILNAIWDHLGSVNNPPPVGAGDSTQPMSGYSRLQLGRYTYAISTIRYGKGLR